MALKRKGPWSGRRLVLGDVESSGGNGTERLVLWRPSGRASNVTMVR